NWLRHCGVVMQEARIFSGSILENVSLSEESPEIGRVLNLLEIVGLKGFIESLPMGVYTNLGVAGIKMSGGQKQRLMIARALYKDPDLLFLDEATSSLDANNEKSIVANISNLSKGKTIVIAAHRLSTVQDADKIVFVKDGTIAEMGTHSELVRLKGYYWKLVKNQLQLSE
ncbi:MAG: ATP-binding cassette domain-containing protein, partial [Muribaculaceae bacterium]|nr:ATP-binding cassette domain-containing protein [Muribaculaceae bacterium]